MENKKIDQNAYFVVNNESFWVPRKKNGAWNAVVEYRNTNKTFGKLTKQHHTSVATERDRYVCMCERE